jgi:hypothetical protein
MQLRHRDISRRDSLKWAARVAVAGLAPWFLPSCTARPAVNRTDKELEMTDFDITDGYDSAVDYLLATPPKNPKMRESVSMWISDDQGRFGFPRFCIEAIAEQWDYRGIEANIAFPDGRVLIGAGGFPAAPPKMVDGRAVTLSAGPLRFEVIEPLRRWAMSYDGNPYETTVQEQARGVSSGPERRVQIELEAEMAAPPWTPGEQAVRERDQSTASAIGAIGGHRHEQLFRCTGRFRIEGETEYSFSGTGLFIRRTGVRELGDFPGHCWQSALFPSGKAFGILGFPARSDGTPAYGEGFVFDGQQKRYAKIVEAPWMTEFIPNGGAVDVVLETDTGEVRIGGKTHDSTIYVEGNPIFGDWKENGQQTLMDLPFHQGGALYQWDGESAYGMIERSLPTEKVKL